MLLITSLIEIDEGGSCQAHLSLLPIRGATNRLDKSIRKLNEFPIGTVNSALVSR